jgi:hypothetical protein
MFVSICIRSRACSRLKQWSAEATYLTALPRLVRLLQPRCPESRLRCGNLLVQEVQLMMRAARPMKHLYYFPPELASAAAGLIWVEEAAVAETVGAVGERGTVRHPRDRWIAPGTQGRSLQKRSSRAQKVASDPLKFFYSHPGSSVWTAVSQVRGWGEPTHVRLCVRERTFPQRSAIASRGRHPKRSKF